MVVLPGQAHPQKTFFKGPTSAHLGIQPDFLVDRFSSLLERCLVAALRFGKEAAHDLIVHIYREFRQ